MLEPLKVIKEIEIASIFIIVMLIIRQVVFIFLGTFYAVFWDFLIVLQVIYMINLTDKKLKSMLAVYIPRKTKLKIVKSVLSKVLIATSLYTIISIISSIFFPELFF